MANEIGFNLPASQMSGAGGIVGHTGNMLKDFAKVLLPNGAVVGVVTFSQLEMTLKITLLVISIIYTTLHIVLLWRKLRNKKSPQEPDI